MHGQRQFADLIQKQRAAVCEFEFPRLTRVSARKSSALMAEQFVFHQCFRYGSAIQRYKRPGRTRAEAMNGARKQFFPSTARSQQQHSGIGSGDGLHLATNFHHGCVLPYNARETEFARVFVFQHEVFAE